MIGRACVPQALRDRMLHLPVVILDTPMEQRVEISLDAYVVELLQMYQQCHGEAGGFLAFAEHHRKSLGRIVKRLGGANYKVMLALFEQALCSAPAATIPGRIPAFY